MNIFDKRPLSLVLCIMLGGFVIFSLYEALRIFLIAFALLLPLVPFFVKRLCKKRILFIISSIALLFSILFSYLYFDKHFKVYERFSDQETEIEGTVTDITQKNSYSKIITVKSKSIDGEKETVKLNLRLPLEEAKSIEISDSIVFKATLTDFVNDDGVDRKSYYFSKGISADARNVKDIEIVKNDKDSLYEKLSTLRERIRRKAILMSDYDSGSLLGALLTGERDELSYRLSIDFRQIGISHVLALSGMHLAILALAIDRLLRLLKMPKRGRMISVIIFSLLYMFFVGFTVSVVRAGIMLIITYTLRLLYEGSDSLTSLSVAVFLICLFTPYAIYDISLWLSAFATLGVICSFDPFFENKSKREEKDKKKLLDRSKSYIKAGLLSTVFAISATLYISVRFFGGISLVSIVTTLIFSPLIETYMYLGSIMLLLGLIFEPLSLPFAFLLKKLYKLIFSLAEFFAELEYSYVSADFDIIKLLILLFTALFFVLLIFKFRKAVVYSLLLSVFSSVFLSAFLLNFNYSKKDEILYYSYERADVFYVNSGGERGMISSSRYSESLCYKSLDVLRENKASALESFIVTHYSYDLSEELFLLLSSVRVEKVYIPAPRNEDEDIILSILKSELSDSKTDILTYRKGDKIAIGSFNYSLLYSEPYGIDTSKNAFVLSHKGGSVHLYLSSGMLEDEYDYLVLPEMKDAASVIFGAHGKKYKTREYLDVYFESVKKLILSGEDIFLTQTAYSVYKENGCEIYSHPKSVKIFSIKR